MCVVMCSAKQNGSFLTNVADPGRIEKLLALIASLVYGQINLFLIFQFYSEMTMKWTMCLFFINVMCLFNNHQFLILLLNQSFHPLHKLIRFFIQSIILWSIDIFNFSMSYHLAQFVEFTHDIGV